MSEIVVGYTLIDICLNRSLNRIAGLLPLGIIYHMVCCCVEIHSSVSGLTTLR
jgi:hypothetical protein